MKRITETKRGRLLLLILGAVVLLASVLLAFYPILSNSINERYKSSVITNYDDLAGELETDEQDAMLEAARLYNMTLVPGIQSTDREAAFTEEQIRAAAESYYDILMVRPDGMMGYIEIPAINVYLPIYHSTSDAVLERGIGHLIGTSLPVGGESTRAVLSGHSGMARDRMFTDLEDVEEGDVFYIHVLNEVLAYRVCDIQIVLPEEVGLLTIIRGRDLVSLVTCTPFGINTHRLVVTGERIQYDAEDVSGITETHRTRPIRKWTWEYLKGLLLGLGIALITLSILGLVLFLRKMNAQAAHAKHRSRGGRHSKSAAVEKRAFGRGGMDHD